MYYILYRKLGGKAGRIHIVLFALVISLLTFQKADCAEPLDLTAEEYRAKGYEEQKKGNLLDALNYYNKAVVLGLENGVLYNDIGVIYEHLGDPVRAKAYYLKATQRDPDYLPPYTNLAYLAKAAGDTAAAIRFFQERYRRAGEDDPWREQAKDELIKLDPRFRQVFIEREAGRLSTELAAKAQEEFAMQVLRAERHYQEGQKYVEEKRYGEAVVEFDRALQLTPQNPKILSAKDAAERGRKIAEAAEKTWQALDDLSSGDVAAAKKKFQEILATIPE